MGIINILDAQTANMIAAGEVVDRPASALKELLENAIDAKATKITVDLKGGGRTFLRVSDNGCGFYRDDMPKALLRHATSKIKTGADLEAISTNGFRGEALAAISSVSVLEIISKRREESTGTRLTCDEAGVVMTDTGCADGTTVTVRNLFYNTPARQKFLKSDRSETSACISVAAQAALSHPEISFALSSEGERKFYTAGDGRLLQAIHSIYGKEFASSLRRVDGETDAVKVFGYITLPSAARGNRSMQFFFINRRPVRSKTVMAAMEEAFRSYLPRGRYPGGVLFIDMPYGLTDVNVHPAKLEIRFADEKPVFSAVYYAVKNCLTEGVPKEDPAEDGETVPETEAPAKEERFIPKIGLPYEATFYDPKKAGDDAEFDPLRKFIADLGVDDLNAGGILEFRQPTEGETGPVVITARPRPKPPVQGRMDERPYWKLIGEAYNAYLFVETEDEVLIVDKHAAHERILYEQLSSRKEVYAQGMNLPLPVDLHRKDVALLMENAAYLEQFGFTIEPFGDCTILIRSVPSTLSDTLGLQYIMEEFAKDLSAGSNIPFAEKCDRALFTVSCKAALKAGIPNDPAHNEWIVRQLMENPNIRYCPHGRPVIHVLRKREIEKFFDR